MAKQRPHQKGKTQHSAERPAQTGAQANRPAPAEPAQAAPPPARRSTYFEAVALYERGLEALQQHDYAGALEKLNSVLKLYPEEKELHERVRLYLNVCERHVAPSESTPVTIQDRLYAATLAINGGRYDEALMHLRLVRDEDPDNDHALYMLAVAHTQRDELAEALAHLERAFALNPENRGIARQDPDLDPLRQDDAFKAALDAPATTPTDRRRPTVRPRSGR